MSREILKSIINEFDPEKFIRFFREKNRKFTPRTEVLAIYNDDDFSNCIRIGKVDFQGGTFMTICSLNTDKSLTERSGKKSQYEKGKKILKETQSDSGIFIFYDRAGNFRFSLIYANYLGKKRDWSTFKRFTYFVCKDFTNKTFIQRIGDSDFSSLENIKDGFSVEKVNKEFFNEIAIKFSELVGGQRVVKSKVEKFKPLIKLPSTNDHQKMQEFAVRMIGRIVFCWFLKKKKSQNGIPLIPENLLSGSAIEKNKNYYHSVLENLFFEVLNTKQEDRKKFKGYELYKDIPFLNGGLFEPQEDDLYKPSLVNSLIIPDKWLSEFFNILESYNFTIDENTSIDVELSIDPEMLGRIFENLLAEINPDTGETARKSTGSYYTPRPIVEYMVDESLKQYLIARTDIPESKLSMLLSYSSEEAEISEKESVKIVNALDEIKIIDPACGSGAFPIGILQKMLLILQKIDKNSSKWLEKKLNKIESSILRKELKEKFKNENLDYIRKLGLIQDSIYGVDIQSIAVEISKLRCFLTLIVDEDVDDKKPNRGIIPLPNLEFKFVAANTLISLPEEEGSLFDESENIKQLEGLRDEYFTSYGQKKLDIESDYLTIQEKMFKKLLRNGITGGRAFELAGWFPFFNEKANWFDPKWMFGIEDGFDIVIGNPPYINISNIKPDEYRLTLRHKFRSAKNKSDIYAFFLERGFQLLCPQGILAYIIPQTWKATDSFTKLREIIFKEMSLIKVVDLDYGTFEAIVKPMIVLISNEITKNNQIEVFNNSFEKVSCIGLIEILNDSSFSLNTKLNKLQKEVYKIIEKGSVQLESIIQFSRGIKTSNDNRFIHLIAKNKDYKKIFRGKNIKPYQLKWNGEYLWYRPDLMKEKVGSVPYTKEYFEVPEKVVTQRVSKGLTATYDTGKNYFLDTCIVSNYQTWRKNVSLKYITAILNSSLIGFWFENKYQLPTVGIYELHSVPIKDISNQIQRLFSNLVDQIIQMKSLDKDTSLKENQIDVMVYKLYELTYDEVKIVDPEFWMSEGEYERFKIIK